jgi:hypothetical protein
LRRGGAVTRMINQPETQGKQPEQGSLVLPAYPQQVPPVHPDQEYKAAHPNTGNLPYPPIRPDQLIRRTTTPPPQNLLVRLLYFWKKDPAYKVMMIAVVLVVIASLLFVSAIGNALLRSPNFLTIGSNYSSNPPTPVVPTGTVDLRPTFPPPGGGNGSTSSSQPPTQGTPSLQSTADAPPTTNPGGGSLSITITNIPSRVPNNSVVSVSVNTGQPDVTVTLEVIYNVPPYRYVSAPVTTDGNGNAVLSWSVAVIMYGHQSRAYVFAVGRDQNGQRVQSQAATVQIVARGIQ